MKRIGYLLTLVVFASSGATADVLVLRSGESVTGQIVSAASETNAVQIEVANSNRTIFSIRTESASNIVAIQRATVEQQAQQKAEDAFAQLSHFRLSRISYPVAAYDRVINSFQGFLADYPDSSRAMSVSNSIQQWTEERNRVAAGEIKWSDTWYSGGATAVVAVQIKAVQLIADGDQYVSLGKYDLAIGKFKEALLDRPLLPTLVDSINSKINDAISMWRTTGIGGGDTANTIADLGRSTQQLRDQATQLQNRIVDIQKRRDSIANARKVYGRIDSSGHWVGSSSQPYPGATAHWIINDRDIGNTLPVSPSLGTLPGNLNDINAQIAKNEANKLQSQTSAQSRAQTETQREAQIGGVANECARLVALARTQPITESTMMAMRNEPSKPSVTTVVAAAQMPQEPQQPLLPQKARSKPAKAEPWLQKYWLPILVGAIVILWLFHRLTR